MRLELGVAAWHNGHKVNLRKGGYCGHVKVWKKIDFFHFSSVLVNNFDYLNFRELQEKYLNIIYIYITKLWELPLKTVG